MNAQPQGSSVGTGGSASRLAAWAGIAFAVLFVVGFVIGGEPPDYDAPDNEWIEWVDDDGDRGLHVTGTFLITASGLALVVFAGAVASHVERGRGLGSDQLARTAWATGTVAGAMVALAALTNGAITAAVTFAPDFETPSADVIRSLDQVGFGILLLGAGWAMVLFVATVSRAAASTATLPTWLTRAGYVVAFLLLFSFMFIPFVLVPLWALVTGIVLLRERGDGEPAAT